MSGEAPGRGEDGQGTVEWIGLVSLTSLLLVGVLAAAGARVPGTGLARSLAARLLCAADLSESCTSDSRLLAAYGPVGEEQLLRSRVLAVFLCATLALYARHEGMPSLEREAIGGLERASASE